MTTNRHLINEMDLIQPDQLLEQGIPLPLLSKKYEVKEGFNAVILVGGVFEETLMPGFYYLSKYKLFRNIRVILVDTRIKQLFVSTNRNFTIGSPVSVQVDLDLTVDYRVYNPRIVALEVEKPLASLHDRVIEALTPIVSNTNIDECRKNEEKITRNTLGRLKAMQLEKTIGIEVLNIFITKLSMLDTQNDALGQQELDSHIRIQNLHLDNTIMQNTRITPEWLIINRPDLYKAIQDGKIEVLKILSDSGAIIDPASFLNQPLNMNANNDPTLLNNLLSEFGLDLTQSGNKIPINNSNQLVSPNPFLHTKNLQDRMDEEISYLKKLPGAKVKIGIGKNDNDIPDNSYNIMIEIPKNSGGTIVCYIACKKEYPIQPPSIEIEVNGEETPFESSILRHWNQQYLIELVREVIDFSG
ncbi:MAG: SPFH domain-containing protein [Anaerolineaceae bacterium]